MIEARGLTKRYGDKLAVDGLTFTVRPGRRHRLPRPERRRQVHDDADDPRAGRADERLGDRSTASRTGSTPRRCTRSAPCWRPARSTRAAAPTTTCWRWPARSGIRRSRVDEVIEAVGLAGAARRRAGRFSLGMGQRLGIATALLGDPRTVILDEPLNGLDTEGIRWVRSLLQSLAAEGRTVFVSSHLMNEMALTAQHLIVIGKGRLIADTGMAEFVATRGRSVVRVRTTAPGRARRPAARARRRR